MNLESKMVPVVVQNLIFTQRSRRSYCLWERFGIFRAYHDTRLIKEKLPIDDSNYPLSATGIALEVLQDPLEETLKGFRGIPAAAPIELPEPISFILWLQENFRNLFESKRKFPRQRHDLAHNTEKYI